LQEIFLYPVLITLHKPVDHMRSKLTLICEHQKIRD